MMKQQILKVDLFFKKNLNYLRWSNTVTAQDILSRILRYGKKIITIGSALLAITLSDPVFASPLYSQPPTGTGISNSFVTTDPNGSEFDTWTYDNFVATQSGAASNISWEGQASLNTGFTIQILTAQPTTPDSPVSSQVVRKINVPNNYSQVANINGWSDFQMDLTTSFS